MGKCHKNLIYRFQRHEVFSSNKLRVFENFEFLLNYLFQCLNVEIKEVLMRESFDTWKASPLIFFDVSTN